MPTRVTGTTPRLPTTPVAGASSTGTTSPTTPVRGGTRPADSFDTTRPRADGSLLLGRRSGGPGEVTLSKKGQLLLDGRTGAAAAIETARLIETGVSPFRHATDAQRAALTKSLIDSLSTPKKGKQSASAVLARSASATLLLSLARTSTAATRDAALAAYVGAMTKEPSLQLKASMSINLSASGLSMKKALATTAAQVRAQILPASAPYDEWFKGQTKPKLEVRHYVMDEFWKNEISGYKKRGFEIASQSAKEVVFKKVLKDPTGQKPDVTVNVVMKQAADNVLRDMNDPKVHMIVYSGHSSLGAVFDESLRDSPASMKGTKLIQMFSCRGKQSIGTLNEKFPGAHVTTTASSAYGEDDVHVLDGTYEMIASRGSYADVRKGLKQHDLLQPASNYILPDDARHLSLYDNDLDGVADLSAIGSDAFFDPASRRAKGGAHVFTPSAVAEDPQRLSGAKIEHAVNYANTAFFYYAEENRAAPLRLSQTDRMVPGGWFSTPGDDSPVRFTESRRNGQTYYSVAVNAKYADKSREAITSMVLFEMQKYLSQKSGAYTADDKLRGLVLVAGYLDLNVEYADEIDAVLTGFSKKYGFSGVTYDQMYKAMLKDGHEGTATKACLDYMKAHGMRVQ